MSFKYQGQLSGGKENPVTLPILIANSQDVAVGEALVMQTLSSGGGCLSASAGSKVIGICVGIVNADGIDLDNANPATYDGTWVSSTKTYTASSDNMTDKKVKALVVVDREALWNNDTAGDLAAADEFKFFDLTSATQIANQNGDDAKGAFVLISRDPDGDGDASKGLFIIAESGLDAYAQQS